MADDDVYVRLQGRYAMLLQGVIKVEDLEDEELARGQLKAADGSWRGRPPKLVPRQLLDAMRGELVKRAHDNLQAALLGPGIKTLTDLAENAIDEGVRLRAATAIIERVIGKVPDKVHIAAEDPVEALLRSVLSDPAGLAPHEPSAEERALL